MDSIIKINHFYKKIFFYFIVITNLRIQIFDVLDSYFR